ncbi:TPA: hypothetical protein ACPJ1P_004618 [Vibrio diabolicus]
MVQKTNEILDKAEELLSDTVNSDVEIIRDRLSYITWLTALASAGIAFAMSQKSIMEVAELPTVWGFDIKIISFFCLFSAIVIGVFAKYQAHQSMRNNRIILAMAKLQRLPFYSKKMEEKPLTFFRKYNDCEYLHEEHKAEFDKYQKKAHRIYSEEYLMYLQAVLFTSGYGLVASIALGVW